MREGINGHVAAEHAPLGTEHLHQRHYPRPQLLLAPIHAEDAFHGRDADTGVTASADGIQIGLPSPIAIDAKINRPAHYCNSEANFWILADYVQEIGKLRGEHFQPAAQIPPFRRSRPFNHFGSAIRSARGAKRRSGLWLSHPRCWRTAVKFERER